MMVEEKGSKSESEEEQAEDEWQFDQEQYDRLIECSKRGSEGIKEWNKWREENLDEEIWLEGAELEGAKLRGVNLQEANLFCANLQGAELDLAKLEGAKLLGAKLEGAKLSGAKLEGAILLGAKLEGADLGFAKLEGANLEDAKLEGADLSFAKLEGANLEEAKLQGAELWNANLKGAKLQLAKLQGANVKNADLEGANLQFAKLQGAKFMGVIVDGATSFLGCEIDENTDFRHTGLENARIESGTKYLLKYNIRRMNWEDWYGKHWFLQWPVRLFWWVSDYGISTGRIMFTFFNLAVWFAVIYLLWPDCVMVNGEVGDIRGTVHAIYFSVVTTLGFGDIAANPDSWQGQVALMVEVILGYVLWGALVTRFAVLFTSDGPAGSYTAMGEETKALLGKLKKDKEKAG